MQDKSINGALLALRKQIIRGKLDGLEHVEALLTLRGVPMPAVLPAKRTDAARKGQMRRWILGELRGGPKTLAELSDVVAVHRPHLSQRQLRNRVSQVLYKLKGCGLVENGLGPDGCLWRLQNQDAAS